MFSWFGKERKAPEPPHPVAAGQPSVRDALLSERPSDIFSMWARMGHLAQILPDLDALRGVSQLPAHRDNAFIHTMKAVDAIEPLPTRRWAALLHDIAKAPTYIETPDGRSHFFEHDKIGSEMAGEIMAAQGEDPALVSAVRCLVRLHMRPLSYREGWSDAAVKRLVEDAEEARGRAGWDDLIALSRADLRGYLPEPIDRGLWVLEQLEARRRRIDDFGNAGAIEASGPQSPLDGTELLSLTGLEPGPWVGRLKSYLQAEVAEGRLDRNDKPAAADLARHWLVVLKRET